MHYWGDYGWGWGMGFMMIVFWVLVIVGSIYLLRYLSRGASFQGRRETPIEILKRRYAAGEITKEQFDRIKSDLEK